MLKPILKKATTTLAAATMLVGTAYAQDAVPPAGAAPTPEAAPASAATIGAEVRSQPTPPTNGATKIAKENVTSKFAASLYGFVEFDAIHDSTQSLNESGGNGALARPGSFRGDRGRTIFSGRNSRLGFKLTGPTSGEVKTSAILEMDFLGNQPAATENAFVTNPTFRFRHYAFRLETPVVDLLVGQYWQLFGWQSMFHPNTVGIQGVPGQVYSRNLQFRLSRKLKSEAVDVELAVAAVRPVVRDSETPDGQAGIRFVLNHWKALHTAGSTGTAVDGASIGVSGMVRRFAASNNAVSATGIRRATGSGISVDALVPVVPAASVDDWSNALTLTGSFATGSGISDQYSGLTGGLTAPTVAMGATYTIDPGLATFDVNGKLAAVKWTSFIVGAQYYLPLPSRVWISANYSRLKSSNLDDLVAAASDASVFDESYWYDGNLFWDVNAAVRFGFEYARFHQKYLDGKDVDNHRFQLSGFYIF